MSTCIQHLMEGLHHLSQADCDEIIIAAVRRQIWDILSANTEDLQGTAFIDRLTDEELRAAIVSKDPRLELYFGPGLLPQTVNYLRHNRPAAASVLSEV